MDYLSNQIKRIFSNRSGESKDLQPSAPNVTCNRSVESKDLRPSAPNVTWHHIWPSIEARDALSKSPFRNVPNEILLRIFQLLSVRDLCHVSLVCRSFKMIADQDDIWKFKCRTTTKLYSKSSKQMYMEWIYEKCLHNINVHDMTQWFRTGCIRCSPPSYPVRPADKHRFESIGGFSQHPNSSANMTIKLSVDIDNTARELIKLLEKASPFQQQWQQSSILKQMITRYHRFMQLKASYPPNILLIPTLDIEIVWQTHLLRPEMYRADCRRLFRRIIDHSLLMTDIPQSLKEQAFRDTCQLYEQRFGEQYCPLPPTNQTKQFAENASCIIIDSYRHTNSKYSYWDKTYFEFSPQPPKDFENPFSLTEADIILDFNWLSMCKQFMRDALEKVPVRNNYRGRSTKIDLRQGAMIRLKKSYERFLYMAAKYPLKDGNGFVPPTYAIDIIWHSHMQEPLNYEADCNRLVGYVIFHSPWPMIEDDTMKKTRDKTDDIWKQEFESDITTDHLYNTVDSAADWAD